jgi:Tol biopolymer transport system component/predicted Ser/Thr protein kinase
MFRMSLKAGTRLGAYEIVNPLGYGGMGEVYRARDTRLDRLVALKVLPNEFAGNGDRRRRFEQEARAVAALNHPNVVSVYDVGEDYFVSELIDGEPLRAVRLPFRTSIDVAAQIAEGLAAAHAAGIIHRDLKPENILLTKDGRAKILDFGLAKVDPARSGDVMQTVTDPGIVMGTVGYMSPEQIRGQDVDHRSDIFSFGLILYELLSGARAFHRQTLAETMAAIVNEDLPDLPPTIPGALSHIVAHCVAKQPASRFQNAKDLAFALRALSGVQSTPAPQLKSRRVDLWKVASGVLAVLLGMSFWAALRERPSELGAVRLFLNPPPEMTFTDSGGAISPDGRAIAFVAAAPGKQTLWIRHLDSTTLREFPGTEAASYPFWSPDSKSIAFFSAGKLKSVRLSGGLPEVICAAQSGRGGSWGTAGVIVFAPTAGGGLQQVPAGGGEPKPATQLSAARQETEHRWPQLLPDGNRFLYWSLSSNPDHRGIYASSLSAPQQNVRILATNFKAEYAPQFSRSPEQLLWIRDDSLVAQRFDSTKLRLQGEVTPVSNVVGTGATGFAHFSVSPNGVLVYGVGQLGKRSIEWWDRRGTLLKVEAAPSQFYGPRLSPDGSRLAVSRVDQPNSDIWLYEFSRRTMTRLTVEPGFDNYSVWSPDGKKVVSSASRAGPRNLYVRSAAGRTVEERLTQSPHAHYSSDWSPDGRYVVFTEVHPKSAGDIWLVRADLSAPTVKPEPFLATPFDETNGRLSPDGKWMAYASNESGPYEVYVQAFRPGGTRWSVSNRSGSHPVWRADGRELFFVSESGRLMSVAVKPTSTGLEFSTPQELFAIPTRRGEHFYDYDVASDGQRFIVLANAVQGTPEPLMVLLNWHSTLQK